MKIKRLFYYFATPRYKRDSLTGINGPWDMLRYDTAFVNENAPGIVLIPVFAGQTIGNGPATLARWDSFGWKLELTDEETAMRTGRCPHPGMRPEGWYTMKHSATSYSSYVKLTLKEVKEWDDMFALIIEKTREDRLRKEAGGK